MDRDNNYDRVEKAYLAMTKGEGNTAESAVAGIQTSYYNGVRNKGICNENYLRLDALLLREPTSLQKPVDHALLVHHVRSEEKDLQRRVHALQQTDCRHLQEG